MGFCLALKYFENHDIISWFSDIKHIPWIFINIHCYIDNLLGESLKINVPKGRSLKRAFYTYVIIDASRFVSLMSRQSGFCLGENVVQFCTAQRVHNLHSYLG